MRKLIRFNNINLTIAQLIRLGIHVGHTVKNSKFFASWMFDGIRSKYMIINLSKTYLAFKRLEWIVELCIARKGKILFVEFDRVFMSYIARYALLCGETFVVYRWIAGIYSNAENVLKPCFELYKFFLKRSYLTNKEKIKLKSFIGLLYSRLGVPGLTFLSRVKSTRVAALEMALVKGITVGVVDTDIETWDVKIPIPGNDESIICLNFYVYFLTYLILLNKIKLIKKWKRRIRVIRRGEYTYNNWMQLLLKKNKGNFTKHWDRDMLKFVVKEYSWARDKNVIHELYNEFGEGQKDFFSVLQE